MFYSKASSVNRPHFLVVFVVAVAVDLAAAAAVIYRSRFNSMW